MDKDRLTFDMKSILHGRLFWGNMAFSARYAETQFLSENRLTQEHWPQTFFQFKLENMLLSKFMGTGPDNIFQINKDLDGKEVGDLLTFQLELPLSNAGQGDDGTLENNEESMNFYNFRVQIHERSNAVRSAGKMSDKRTKVDIRRQATGALGRWAAEQEDNDLVYALSGLGNQDTYAGEGTSDIATVNEHAPSANRILYGGQSVAGVLDWEASDSALTTANATGGTLASYLFGTQVISTVKRNAQLCSPKFRPIRINGKAYYVMFIHPLQTKALRAETGSLGWSHIQAAANVRGINNPLLTRSGSGDDRIFDGAVGVWDDVILYEYDRIRTRVAGEVFDSGDTVGSDIVDGSYAIARALLCGAQAGTIAWGQRWKRYEKDFDYNRKPGTAIDALYGVSKTVFNDPGASQSTNTAQEDFATYCVDTVVVND